MKIVIDRTKVNPDWFTPHSDKKDCDICYVGNFVGQILNPPTHKSWYGVFEKYIRQNMKKDPVTVENNITKACYNQDEIAAKDLFAELGVEVEFIGERYSYLPVQYDGFSVTRV